MLLIMKDKICKLGETFKLLLCPIGHVTTLDYFIIMVSLEEFSVFKRVMKGSKILIDKPLGST